MSCLSLSDSHGSCSQIRQEKIETPTSGVHPGGKEDQKMAMAATPGAGGPMTRGDRKVILRSSVGTTLEWYDFYLAGSLAVNIAATFFSGVNPTAAFIFTLLGFAAGFAVRPFGALFFGSLGDLIGRKYTFLVTMTLMGVSTFVVGLLPSYA